MCDKSTQPLKFNTFVTLKFLRTKTYSCWYRRQHYSSQLIPVFIMSRFNTSLNPQRILYSHLNSIKTWWVICLTVLSSCSIIDPDTQTNHILKTNHTQKKDFEKRQGQWIIHLHECSGWVDLLRGERCSDKNLKFFEVSST